MLLREQTREPSCTQGVTRVAYHCRRLATAALAAGILPPIPRTRCCHYHGLCEYGACVSCVSIHAGRNSYFYVFLCVMKSTGNAQMAIVEDLRAFPLMAVMPTRDTNRISTRFFFGVQNMSRCVKYQKPGQAVGVGFCHSCHSVKMRPKHLGLLESSRGPPDHVQTDTDLVSDHI